MCGKENATNKMAIGSVPLRDTLCEYFQASKEL